MAKILFVDDEELLLKAQVRGLASLMDHEVTTAINGAKALEIIRRERFDLVVTDYDMSEMNGAELFRKVQEELSGQVLAWILTTAEENEFARFSAETGWPLLKKPYGLSQLVTAVNAALALSI